MNRSVLRKIAAATAIFCDELDGGVDMFFAIKAIYLGDRQMLVDYGTPITGDRYSSMPQGPILCATYDLMAGKFTSDKSLQTEWNRAFSKNGNLITPRAKVDVDCLAPAEEAILREKISLVMQLDKDGVDVADWMHKNCPEWEEVAKGTSRPLPLRRMISFAKKMDPSKAKELEDSIGDGMKNRDGGEFSKQPLLVAS
jgi:hypothetical protein